MKLSELRRKYPRFIYDSFSYKISGNNLEIVFYFKTEPGLQFSPKIIIGKVDREKLNRVGDSALKNFIFHLGLAEMPSYWKATCSPQIVVKAGFLDSWQIRWWKKLFLEGMGQYFYENRIDFRKPNFLTIKSEGRRRGIVSAKPINQKKILVPVSGGKDSVVTLETLKNAGNEIGLFMLNPSTAALAVANVSGVDKQIVVRRQIDPTLLKLNEAGFLNGHTPFSSVLAFLSLFCAALFGYGYVAFSNERSSNEGNVKYLGKEINHQWSKSLEFENMFRAYEKKYLTNSVEYFSFLRPLYEIQISQLFSKCPRYFPVFNSCNKSSHFCGNCSKCLFVFMSLYPFIPYTELINVFGSDLYDKKELLPILKSLLGITKVKPFECVGTRKESLAALRLSLENANTEKELPFLLKYSKKLF